MHDATLEAIDEVHKSFKKMAGAFSEDVLRSHGNHVPLKVRNYSVALFWMPGILQEKELSADSACWSEAKPMLDHVLGYVSNQVKAFDWPGIDEVFRQYVTLMCLWWRLGRKKAVVAALWGHVKTDARGREVAETPSRDTGAASKPRFMWKEWWRITHTQQRFRPEGLEGAFALYHHLGSLGISEALAESICSTLGRHASASANGLELQRVVEKPCCVEGLHRL